MHSSFSRRGFFKAGAALAVASSAGIDLGAFEPPAARAAASDMPTVAHAPFHKPADLPPVKFMRDKIPQAAVVSVRGEYTDALVPDTCDLEERARLFVDDFLNSITVPELRNEPFNRGRFDLLPGVSLTRATVLDIMNGTGQELDYSANGGDAALKGILIKDYPVFVKIGL